MGKDGSRAYYKPEGKDEVIVEVAPFLSDETIETTGAGDTFCGTVIHYLLQYGVDNLDEAASQTRSVMLIVSIIVYGFILVVTFIGITSVFNTINSNMELRKRDFASLKSIGMTRKEFNNMINLEAVFYSIKSLVYGIILGLLGSYVIFKLFTRDYYFEYQVPYKSILIAILFIIVIVLIIMRYSIKKINKQNIIETIRNSNI